MSAENGQPDLTALSLAIRAHTDLPTDDLRPLTTTGLAHAHVAIGNTGWLARVPLHSQHGHAPEANLRYQVACFHTAEASGVTPRFFAELPVSPGLPMGALIVERIDGRPAHMNRDASAIAACLRTIHQTAVAASSGLTRIADPVADLTAEIRQQAEHLTGLTQEVQAWFEAEFTWIESFHKALTADASSADILTDQSHAGPSPTPHPEPQVLAVTDSHPGNFLIRPDGTAVFVDLEKACIGSAAVDLAHASVYTSTTWMPGGQAADARVIHAFYQKYLQALPDDRQQGLRPWLAPMRRLLSLRALTWCALWLAEHEQPDSGWSKAPDDLKAHVKGRALHYLSMPALERITADQQLVQTL